MSRTRWADWIDFKDNWGAGEHMDDRICPDGPQQKCELLIDIESALMLQSTLNQVNLARLPPLRTVELRSTWNRPETFFVTHDKRPDAILLYSRGRTNVPFPDWCKCCKDGSVLVGANGGPFPSCVADVNIEQGQCANCVFEGRVGSNRCNLGQFIEETVNIDGKVIKAFNFPSAEPKEAKKAPITPYQPISLQQDTEQMSLTAPPVDNASTEAGLPPFAPVSPEQDPGYVDENLDAAMATIYARRFGYPESEIRADFADAGLSGHQSGPFNPGLHWSAYFR